MRRVDDGSELVNAKHAEVGDCECSALVLFRFELAFAGTGGERFGLGGDRGKTFRAYIFDDGCDQSVRCRDGDTDVRSFVAA